MTCKRKCKLKSCGEYGHDYIITPIGAYCSTKHAYEDAMAMQAKAQKSAQKKAQAAKKATNARRKREFYDNDRSFRAKCAQSVFNSYIRERDSERPCISCGRNHGGQYHAGHYRSVGAHPELRFNEDNCHKQCSVCNNHKSGNIADYRIELIKRIGIEKVEWLEGPHDPNKYSCQDLKEIELAYKQKLKQLQSEGE